MSVLGPPPLTGQRGALIYPIHGGCPGPRPSDGDRPTAPADDRPTAAELLTEYARLGADHFGGALPDVEIVPDCALGDRGDGAFLPEHRAIVLRAGLTRDHAARVLAHEAVHAILLAGPEDMRAPDGEDPHGPTFQRVAAVVDPVGAPTSVYAARSWQPRLAPPKPRHLRALGGRISQRRAPATWVTSSRRGVSA